MKKKIWITGASSGIGKALAIKFANAGWQVAASARRENLLNELEKINPSIHSFPLDVIDLNNSSLKLDGTPNFIDRVEIGPTQLAFDEWVSAGIKIPNLKEMREFRIYLSE